MHRLIVSTFALLALIGTAAHAEQGTMRVQVQDLNLNAAPGAQIALRRIKSASTVFCGGVVTHPVGSGLAEAACSKAMTAKAVAQLNAPLVTALYSPQSQEGATRLAQR
ncbi:UrcA family protein [Phenylobacterium sp. Root700]|uniref:UrcA family protein n=1 Tax=Phenylobacterium sp. Root700 TaxID=1736591 RepID=UPI0009EBCE2E|nr:UrcA family protein [Phenylobacterium sp. Root700]